jgi:hypothetical protein
MKQGVCLMQHKLMSHNICTTVSFARTACNLLQQQILIISLCFNALCCRCPVPDLRYEWLCSVWQPPSSYPAYLNLTDIAGLIKGASEGAGLGNAFLSHIQAVDGMYVTHKFSY